MPFVASSVGTWVPYRSYGGSELPWETLVTSEKAGVRLLHEDGGSFVDSASDPQIVEWSDLAGRENIDIKLKVSMVEHTHEVVSGAMLLARMPTDPDLWADDNPGYVLMFRGDRLLIFANSVSPTTDSSALDVHYGDTLTIGAEYWMRYQVVENVGGTSSTLRGKRWAIGDPEPGWQVEGVADLGKYVPPGGKVGWGNAGGQGTGTTAKIHVEYSVLFDVGLEQVKPRVRSNINASVGSLLEATDAPALEFGIQEAFFERTRLDSGTLYRFTEALTPNSIALMYYPVPLTSQERLAEYTGTTKLGRMADTFPSPFMGTAQRLSGSPTMTAQELLTALFQDWASEFDWFTHKDVPDLRYRVEGDDYTGDRGVLTVPAVQYAQAEGVEAGDAGENRRLTMREILDEILAIFPGTAILQDSDGDIVLRPTYGPDAPTSPSKTLTGEDAFGVSTGNRPDPRRVYNRARVTSRAFKFVDDQAIIPDSFILVSAFTEDPLLSEYDTYQRVGGSSAIIPYDGVVDTSQAIEISYVIEIWSTPNADGTNYGLETSESGTITLEVGDSIQNEKFVVVTTKIGEALGIGGWTARSEWGFARFTTGPRVRILPNYTTKADRWYIAHAMKITGVGTKFVQSNESVIGQFGYDLDQSELINEDGQNVVEVSQQRYGEREITISTNAFALTPEQAQEIAQGLVLHHITPRVVRTVEQSWWRAFPVVPDDIGLIVQLPSGEDVLVEERTYTDDYTAPLAPVLASTFRATLTEPAALGEANDDAFTSDGLLAFDSGAWLRFEDGTLAELT